MPDPLVHRASIEEPYVKADIIIPPDYIGAVMELSTERRGKFIDMQYLSTTTVELKFEMPLSSSSWTTRFAQEPHQGLCIA